MTRHMGWFLFHALTATGFGFLVVLPFSGFLPGIPDLIPAFPSGQNGPPPPP